MPCFVFQLPHPQVTSQTLNIPHNSFSLLSFFTNDYININVLHTNTSNQLPQVRSPSTTTSKMSDNPAASTSTQLLIPSKDPQPSRKYVIQTQTHTHKFLLSPNRTPQQSLQTPRLQQRSRHTLQEGSWRHRLQTWAHEEHDSALNVGRIPTDYTRSLQGLLRV